MDRHKFSVLCFVFFLLIESMTSQYQDPDCPDNGMRKPPRFGKRGPQTLLHYSGSPCVRGPSRRAINGPPKRIRDPLIDAFFNRIKNNLELNENEN